MSESEKERLKEEWEDSDGPPERPKLPPAFNEERDGLPDGEAIVIYNPEKMDRWIKSDNSVPLNEEHEDE